MRLQRPQSAYMHRPWVDLVVMIMLYKEGRVADPLTVKRADSTPSIAKQLRSMPVRSPARLTGSVALR